MRINDQTHGEEHRALDAMLHLFGIAESDVMKLKKRMAN